MQVVTARGAAEHDVHNRRDEGLVHVQDGRAPQRGPLALVRSHRIAQGHGKGALGEGKAVRVVGAGAGAGHLDGLARLIQADVDGLNPRLAAQVGRAAGGGVDSEVDSRNVTCTTCTHLYAH